MTAAGSVGKSEIRVDGRDKVSGKALYPADIFMENMAYGVTIRSSMPSAKITLDKKAALACPGVLDVLSAQDVPGRNAHGVLIKDQEVFVSSRVRSIGEPIAFVVGETIQDARAAAALVKVSYSELPAVFDPIAAMTDTAPLLYDESNILYHFKLRKGSTEEAFSQCDIIVENIYQSSMTDHAFLQPEAAIAYRSEDGAITVIVATQYPHFDREEIAESLGIPQSQVRILTAAVGGAFGGREDITLQIHTALAAYKLKRPIKTVYSREESFAAHSKRHPMYMRYRTGAKKDGILHAQEAEITGDAGAHASWSINVLRKAGIHASGPYEIPNIKVDSRAVYTNNPFTGAMRGFGAAQVAMAYEQQIDEIARRLGINPIEIRLKNFLKQGSATATGQILEEPIPLAETLIRADKAIGCGFGEDKI